MPDFFGENILVNGKVWPYLEVEPRKYRFRIINGSNSRFYRMSLSSGQIFYQIGTDGGFFQEPIIAREILLGPAERADVIIDFSKFEGCNIVLANNAPSPYPRGNPVNFSTDGQIMQFRVSLPLSSYDFSTIPYRLSTIIPLDEKKARLTRNLTLVRETDQYGRAFLLQYGKRWDDPITIKAELGSIEIWNLINLANSTHPIHIHLVNFQIISRQSFDVEFYKKTENILTTGPKVLPDLNERGWKDTLRANPVEITKIIMEFFPYAGLYPWHCHILEHEDHEMMRPYEIVNNRTSSLIMINNIDKF